MDASVNLATEKAQIKIHHGVHPAHLIKAVKSAGYDAKEMDHSGHSHPVHEIGWLPVMKFSRKCKSPTPQTEKRGFRLLFF